SGNIVGTTPFTVALVRYDSNGALDSTFGTNGIDITHVMNADAFNFNGDVALVSQPDGKLIAAFSALTNPIGGADFGVARFLGLALNSAGPLRGMTGQKLPFTGSFDEEATADTTGVTWQFGDGTTLTYPSAAAPGALMPTHVYKSFVIYDVTLTISFASG